MIPSDKLQAEMFVEILLKRNYEVAVYDGEEIFPFSRSKEELLDQMGSTDSNTLIIRDFSTARRQGQFLLVYGNEPGVLVADFSDNAVCNMLWDEWNTEIERSV